MAVTREQLRALVERIPDAELDRAAWALERIAAGEDVDAFDLAPLAADELTPDEWASIQEARQEIAGDQGIPHDEVRRRFLGEQ